MLGAVAEDGRDLFFVARQQDRVGCVLFAGVLAAQQVQRRLAAGAQQAVVSIGAAELVADDGRERDAVGVGQGRGTQRDLLGLELVDRVGVDAEGRGQQAADAVGQGLGGSRVTPGVPLHRRFEVVTCCGHALQYYT